MRQNSDLITAVQTLTVTTVYTAAGTNFPSSCSYHSTKAQSPQSAELAGVTVPQPQTAHTHAYTHTHTCIWTHTHAYAHTGSIEAGCGGTRIAFIALLLFHDIVNAVSSLLSLAFSLVSSLLHHICSRVSRHVFASKNCCMLVWLVFVCLPNHSVLHFAAEASTVIV